jgi:hypothetical protein
MRCTKKDKSGWDYLCGMIDYKNGYFPGYFENIARFYVMNDTVKIINIKLIFNFIIK